jgi:hypothetical protein
MNNMIGKKVNFKKHIPMFDGPVDGEELKTFIESVSGKKLKNIENKLIDNIVLSGGLKPVVSFDSAHGKDYSAKVTGFYNKIGVFRVTEIILDDK